MISEFVHNVLPEIIALIEMIGIIVVTVGCLRCFVEYVKDSITKKDITRVRHQLGIAMVIGLEFKMAAEILRTVLVRNQEEILMLGGIIILRAVLAYLIKKDIEGGITEYKDEKPRPFLGIRIERGE